MMNTYAPALRSWSPPHLPASLLLFLALTIGAVAQTQDSTGHKTTEGTSGAQSTPPPAPPLMDGGLAAPRIEASPKGSLGRAGGFTGTRLMSVTSSLGATVGGAQDIGYARKLIESGQVPMFIDFSPEGLYSEHDIPTPSAACDQKLCLSLGYGFAPAADNASEALFVHLGLNSNIRPEEFHRSRLQLALVIDKSGSMQGASMDAVKHALRSLVDRLTPEDELALVEFNSRADLLLPATPVSDRARILAAIDALEADGGTNIEAGLELGFGQLAALPSREGTAKRVMLFTDAMPNVGRTDSASFRKLTEGFANAGIGLTAFGVGVNFGQELIYHITQIRGGNYFFLETPEKIAKVFEQEFDYLVTPLVYDLDVKVATPRGLKLTAVYGLPGWKPGDRDALLHIPTVFLSSNRGAIVLRYERDGNVPIASGDLLASGSLGYTDLDGSRHASNTELRHEGRSALVPGTQFFTHDGMRMAVALTNIYFGLKEGCQLYAQGKKKEAVEVITRASGLARLENLSLHDEGVGKELALLDRLAENIEKGAQGTGKDRPTLERPNRVPDRVGTP